MNSQKSNQDICRICLNRAVVLNWNTAVESCSNVTYRDCFYKYTQLEYNVLDPFSPMLCQICLSTLQNTHSLILTALESHKYFQSTSLQDGFVTIKEDIEYNDTEFETVVVGKWDKEPIVEDSFYYEFSDNESHIKCEIENRNKYYRNITKHKKYKNVSKLKALKKCKDFLIRSDVENDISDHKIEQNKTSEKYQKKTETERKFEECDVNGEILFKNNPTCDQKERLGVKDCVKKLKRKTKEIKNPRMCSFCSKIFKNVYSVKLHEKTHIKDRERKETCNICGVKFYHKRNLNSHKLVHKENREKKHKCEFCNKAFYNKGSLNIHRRIHLGQMIPCSLCTKQFYRQSDLERHMNSHSATTINSGMKKRSRYFVRCAYCDKSILSTSFKSHTAAHLNDPLMKCSICGKEYFRRESCVYHLRKIHKKTNKEYNEFIILYKKNRMSHLYITQNADLQGPDE